MPFNYEKNGEAIYKESFSIIRSEADLSAFTPEEEIIVVRMIHASGMVEHAQSIIQTGRQESVVVIVYNLFNERQIYEC